MRPFQVKLATIGTILSCIASQAVAYKCDMVCNSIEHPGSCDVYDRIPTAIELPFNNNQKGGQFSNWQKMIKKDDEDYYVTVNRWASGPQDFKLRLIIPNDGFGSRSFRFVTKKGNILYKGTNCDDIFPVIMEIDKVQVLFDKERCSLACNTIPNQAGVPIKSCDSYDYKSPQPVDLGMVQDQPEQLIYLKALSMSEIYKAWIKKAKINVGQGFGLDFSIAPPRIGGYVLKITSKYGGAIYYKGQQCQAQLPFHLYVGKVQALKG